MHLCNKLFAAIKIYVLQTNKLIEKEIWFVVTRVRGLRGGGVGRIGWRQKKLRKERSYVKNETSQSLFIDILLFLKNKTIENKQKFTF